jgi:hypothetical protein
MVTITAWDELGKVEWVSEKKDPEQYHTSMWDPHASLWKIWLN